jgi:glycosyltransferase involved in cell wall biosynthesis
VGRLSPAKGLPLLIDACARLRDQGETFTLTVIGDGELRLGLERQIRREKLENMVTLAGVRSSAEIREHIQSARAFVLPSFAEGLPVVIMEALALGRPVVTTAITGIPELVDESCGWLIQPGSIEELVIALSDVLNASEDELNRRGRVGRERTKQMHDAGRNASELMEWIFRVRSIANPPIPK